MFERDRGEDGVHDKRAGSLAVAHKTAQDFPVPSPGSRIPAAGWPSQEEIAASARSGKRPLEHAGPAA
jgi:hypothetical protein